LAELSPYLNSHPIDKAYALGLMQKELDLARNDYVNISTYSGGRLVHTTGDIRSFALKNHFSEGEFYRKGKEKVCSYLSFTRNIRSFPYRVVVRFIAPFRLLRNGKTLVTINGSTAISSRTMNAARSRAIGYAKSPYVSRTVRHIRPSPPRPATETWTRQFLETYEHYYDGEVKTFYQNVVPVNAYRRTWSGSRTPNWGKLKPFQYPVNPHIVEIVDWTENRFHQYDVNPVIGSSLLWIKPFTTVYAPLQPSTTHLPLAENLAISRLIQAAQAGIQANLAQDLAQIGQMTSLIAGNATKIVKSLRQLRRFNFTGAINALTAGRGNQGITRGRLSATKSLASNWLQLQYGWKPLLKDIEGTAIALANMMVGSTSVRSVRVTASAMKEFREVYPPAPTTFFASAKPGVTTWINRTTCKFVVRYRLDNPALAFFAQTGFTNPINLMWEILPFSFVADWFLPIGPYLESLTAFHGLDFVSGSKTLFTRMKMDQAIENYGPLLVEPTTIGHHTAKFRYERIFLNRSTLSGFPTMHYPQLNLSGLTGGVRAQNAIALLVQAFR